MNRQHTVDCEHATSYPLANRVACGLGLFGGRPHVRICEACNRREARAAGNGQPTGPVGPGQSGAAAAPSSLCGPGAAGRAERLVLRSFLSPGDILMLTVAVRELHRAYPHRFVTAVETSAPDLWANNPWVVGHDRSQGPWRAIDMHYPLINQSNQRPGHFVEGYAAYLAGQLGLDIPVTEFRGDIHLSREETAWTNQVEEQWGYRGRFWIMMAGGKYDFTTKWWPPQFYQQVVDHFVGQVQFVQCGQKDHWHPPLRGVFSLVGQTSLRQFIRLMYHADGVICPVTFAMHLAAAVPTRERRLRPCVVIAGGREPPQWEAYPGHQFLHTVGALPCCAQGGCWKGRCQTVGDGDAKDRDNLCERPVQIDDRLRVPQCMTLIRPQDVIRAVERSLAFSA
jgi:ADP-heptose:LPS heptosyltransferase